MAFIQSIIGTWWFLALWLGQSAIALVLVHRELTGENAAMGRLMKIVWLLTVLYSGLIGLLIFRWSGRRQIAQDSLARRGARSTAHCYSGCGAGEVAGIIIAAGILSLGTWPVAIASFALAYVAGLALTIGPLVNDGVPFGEAFRDSFISESASITVMEVVAIGVDLTLAGDAGMGNPLFWSSLAVSLSCGLAAAWPVNIALIRFGLKEGMHDPRDMPAPA